MSYICHAVGARPQFIKLAAVLPEMSRIFPCRILHTGQHYDRELSGEHFLQLGIPDPDWDLGVGSAPHGAQTGRMMERMEAVLAADRPAAVIAYGDTNSTLAAALTSAKLNIPVLHVEAGLRSFDRSTPEEVNRIVTDRVSTLLFCPSPASVDNLKREGITDGVYEVGDVMLDILKTTAGGDMERLRQGSLEVNSTDGHKAVLQRGEYYLATVHRAENADSAPRLRRILGALARLPRPVVFPVHPRTKKALEALAEPIDYGSFVFAAPAGYREMAALLANCRVVYTDSGGLQKEAYYLRVPCATLREKTEWVETVRLGANVLVGDDEERILAASDMSFPGSAPAGVYGDGSAGKRIVDVVESFLSGRQG